MVVVRPEEDTLSRQRLLYFLGISRASAGATAISMNLVVIAGNGRAEPHRHRGYETAVYLLQGRVDVRHDPTLMRSLTLQLATSSSSRRAAAIRGPASVAEALCLRMTALGEKTAGVLAEMHQTSRPDGSVGGGTAVTRARRVLEEPRSRS